MNHKQENNLPCSLPYEPPLTHFGIYRTVAHVHGVGRCDALLFATHHRRVNHNVACTKKRLVRKKLRGAVFGLQTVHTHTQNVNSVLFCPPLNWNTIRAVPGILYSVTCNSYCQLNRHT